MNLMNRMMSSESNPKLNINGTVKGCEYKRLLKFDFYLPKYNLCIESDGNPHFEIVNWSGKYTDEEMEEN